MEEGSRGWRSILMGHLIGRKTYRGMWRKYVSLMSMDSQSICAIKSESLKCLAPRTLQNQLSITTYDHHQNRPELPVCLALSQNPANSGETPLI